MKKSRQKNIVFPFILDFQSCILSFTRHITWCFGEGAGKSYFHSLSSSYNTMYDSLAFVPFLKYYVAQCIVARDKDSITDS